mmetsp:Transcript_101498/g.191025  ORF Transcript_101498/g.191025 Transcript_101498/m.191025 type:complete len:200 (-) Transcript_101498:594-1193(-)
MPLELGDGDVARTIFINILEKRLYLIHVALLILDLLLDKHVLIVLCAFYCTLAEDASDNVKHSEVNKQYKRIEQHHPEPSDTAQWFDDNVPAHSAGDGFEQRKHRPGQRSPIIEKQIGSKAHWVLAALLADVWVDEVQQAIRVEVITGGLSEENAEYVHDHDQKQHGPDQRLQRANDGIDQSPQRPNEPYDADDAEDPH